MKLHRLRSIALALAASLATGVASAGPITPATFFEFSFTDVGVEATGCDPADPIGGFCIASFGTPTSFLDAPPWTFVAPASGSVLTVVDAFDNTDRFEIFDFGASVGLTSAPGLVANCGDDPVVCLADPAMSSGKFAFAAGAHAITIVPVASPGLGAAYLALDVAALPEPGTLSLLGGLFGAMLVSRRARRGARPARAHPGGPAMNTKRLRTVALAAAIVIALPIVVSVPGVDAVAQTTTPLPTRFAGPTSSQPLALTADGAFLVVANPDNNSVSFFDLRTDRNRLLAEVPVQLEPNGVVILPNGSKTYVANTVSGTVSVVRANLRNGAISRPTKHIAVGTEPYGLALTPNGSRLYVSNARSHTVSVIDTATDAVIATIPVDFEPRGLAISNDGDGDDGDETLYVSQFLAFPTPGKVDGFDDAKHGEVTVISTASNTVTALIAVNPIADTGFKAAGDALLRIAPGANFTFTTGAYPNQQNGIGIKGSFAYLPSTGASPNGPVRFNVNTQSLLSVVDRRSNADANRTINLHEAVRDQVSSDRLFLTQPWAIAFKHGADEGYVVSAASNVVVKVNIDPVSGLPAVQTDPAATDKVLQIPVGANPRGIVVNAADSRAYVMNYVSRDVTVIDLTGARETVLATMRAAARPAPGTLAERVHIGRELYNTSVGVFDPAPGTTTPIRGRMSAAGWGSCASCHTPFALSDNVVWIFATGPRRTIAQHSDFDPLDPTRSIQRALNWSAIFDEQEDFEANIRNVSGGAGLIVLGDGLTPDPVLNAFATPNGGRNQLKVRGVGAWDALKAFVQFGIRAPISPVPKTDPDVIVGEALFRAANCQSCHGGPQWTSSRVSSAPPPNPALVANGQLIGELRRVGTFDATFVNEVRANAAAPLGADGFAPASLLSLHAFPETFLHNGAAGSLDVVLNNVTHRSAGTGGVDTLSSASDRAKIVRFVLSIDGATPPIN